MSFKETKCQDCDKVLYTIEGKFATKKDGTVLGFLQKWEDQQGTITHWDKCEIGKAKYEAKKAQDKLARIQQNKVQEPTTKAQTTTLASAQLAQSNNTAKNGIKNPTPEQIDEARRKAEEYMTKFGVDTPQNIRDPQPLQQQQPQSPQSPSQQPQQQKESPKIQVREIMGFEQLTSQQLQRIENKLDAIIKHFKIEYSGLAIDTLDNQETPEE